MNIIQLKFLDSLFSNKTLVLDKQTKTLEPLRDGDEFWRNPKKIYMKLEPKHCVTVEDIVDYLSDTYDTGEDGDRQIKQDTIRTLYEWDDHLSESMPVVAACGPFILYFGPASEYIDMYLTLPTALQNCCKFLTLNSQVLSKEDDFHSENIDQSLSDHFYDNLWVHE